MTTETSAQPTVVVPGSADDPFSVNHGRPANEHVAVQAPVRGEDEPAGGQVTAPAGRTASQPQQAAPTQQPAAPAANPADGKPADKPLTQAEINKMVEDRLREAQSGWDKRNAQLQQELKAEREAREATEKAHRDDLRRIQLEGLRPEQQTQLQQQWAFEDRQAELANREKAITEYYGSVERLRVFQAYAPFGVTEEDLLNISDPAEMEAFAKDKKLAFFEAGGTGAKPSGNGDKPASAAPAGANAHYDAGGSPPAPETNNLITQAGVDSMGANIKNMFASEGNRPW